MHLDPPITSKDSPLVSVGIPIYNEERFLEQTLRSITAIDYPNLEIIIVDNGSTDSSSDICHNYASRYPRILYHTESVNRGAIFSWNKSFELSRGKYFFWSGGHDLWNPRCISLCYKQLEQCEEAVLAFPRTTTIDQENAEIETVVESEFDTRNLAADRRYLLVLQNLIKCNILHGLWRRSSLEGSVLFSLRWGPDKLLIAQMALRGTFLSVPTAQWFRRVVRIPEIPMMKNQRIVRSLDPHALSQEQDKKQILQKYKREFRDAHFPIIPSEVPSRLKQLKLLFLTWYILTVRLGVYPFFKFTRKILRFIPTKFKEKISFNPH